MLKQRVLTALLIAPIAIVGVFFLPLQLFALFIGSILAIAAWEWANLSRLDGGLQVAYGAGIAVCFVLAYEAEPWLTLVPALGFWAIAVIAVLTYPRLRRCWRPLPLQLLLGLVLLVPGYIAMVLLKARTDSNFLILLLFFLVWAADIGAYFAGRAFGKAKLAPKVSPGKSWAGFFGGMLAAVGVGFGMLIWRGGVPALNATTLLFLVGCLVVAVLSVFGDLTISLFKRERGIKDTSNLLPGHGGFLDRLDSLLAAAPLFVVLLLLGVIG
ncbi:MAG: phosphatidate cytidylyltransferase [Gammaproteobacteria bacterium]|nr:phosphatidate cytidylyltransferase [Gammaproteobacteria bacterium]